MLMQDPVTSFAPPGAERCEWDPDRNAPALEIDGHPELGYSGCPNRATLSVGIYNWHLCARCAALPFFKRLRKRMPLRRAL